MNSDGASLVIYIHLTPDSLTAAAPESLQCSNRFLFALYPPPPTMSQVNQVLSSIHSAAHDVKAKLSSKKEESALQARSKLFDHGQDAFVDLNIRFIGASGQCIHP